MQAALQEEKTSGQGGPRQDRDRGGGEATGTCQGGRLVQGKLGGGCGSEDAQVSDCSWTSTVLSHMGPHLPPGT